MPDPQVPLVPRFTAPRCSTPKTPLTRRIQCPTYPQSAPPPLTMADTMPLLPGSLPPPGQASCPTHRSWTWSAAYGPCAPPACCTTDRAAPHRAPRLLCGTGMRQLHDHDVFVRGGPAASFTTTVFVRGAYAASFTTTVFLWGGHAASFTTTELLLWTTVIGYRFGTRTCWLTWDIIWLCHGPGLGPGQVGLGPPASLIKAVQQCYDEHATDCCEHTYIGSQGPRFRGAQVQRVSGSQGLRVSGSQGLRE